MTFDSFMSVFVVVSLAAAFAAVPIHGFLLSRGFEMGRRRAPPPAAPPADIHADRAEGDSDEQGEGARVIRFPADGGAGDPAEPQRPAEGPRKSA